MQHDEFQDSKRSFFAARGRIVLIGFLAVAGFYLVTEHTAHLFGALPYLLVLACPLMHIFMHGGHGHGGHGSRPPNAESSSDDERPGPHHH
jgi:hypothetical protein